MNQLSYSAAVYVDKGKRRKNNEDNFYFNGQYLNPENRELSQNYSAKITDPQIMMGVFDGMGGEEFGEEASYIVADTVWKYHQKGRERDTLPSDREVQAIVKEANDRINEKIEAEGANHIGTTFSLLSVQNDVAKLYNVGDSKAFLFRDGKLKQISTDDTTVARLIRNGVITEEEAKTHPDRHKITQYVGMFTDEYNMTVHNSGEIQVSEGDVFLLSSDGLTDMVEDSAIAEILSTIKNPDAAAKALLQKALDNGGKDNVTVLVVKASTGAKEKKNLYRWIGAAIALVLLVTVVMGIVGYQRAEVTVNGDSAVTEAAQKEREAERQREEEERIRAENEKKPIIYGNVDLTWFYYFEDDEIFQRDEYLPEDQLILKPGEERIIKAGIYNVDEFLEERNSKENSFIRFKDEDKEVIYKVVGDKNVLELSVDKKGVLHVYGNELGEADVWAFLKYWDENGMNEDMMDNGNAVVMHVKVTDDSEESEE